MRQHASKLLLGLVAAFFINHAASADTLIKNAKLVTENGMSDSMSDILISGGKIAAIGSNISSPDNAQVVDAAGKYVTAGLFNANTQIGVQEVGSVEGTVDGGTKNERITASLRIADAFNPHSVVIPYNRALGLTHALIQPSSSTGLFSGVASVVNLSDGDSIDVRDAAMVVSLGSEGSHRAGGSRAAAMAMLRESLEDARDYARNKTQYNSGSRRDYVLSRHDLEALIPVVNGRLPLLVNVNRAVDIERVLEFAKENRVSIILAGVAEGWRVADKIAAAKVPVIFDPIYNLPSSYESLGNRLDNAKILYDAGVSIVFTGMGWQNTHNANLVRQSAGNAVSNGLPYGAAIAAITTNPAKVFGVPGYGKLAKGSDASLVVWSGDPFEMTSNPDFVMINGESYSLENRSSRLKDRYLKSIRESLE